MRRLVLFLFFLSCGEGNYEYSISDVKATSLVVISTLGNLLDEVSGGGFSFAPTSLCLDRAGVQSCNAGRQSITYNGCEASETLITGTVTLDYSDNSCGLYVLNRTVTREFNLIRNNDDGSEDQVFDSNRTDFLDNTYGGGSRLTSLSSTNHQLEILGKHVAKTRSTGFEGFLVSLRTTSDISVTTDSNTLRREGRVLSGGTIEMAHNRLEYLTTYTIGSVSYTSGCCHPTSGTINFTLSDGAQGSGQIQFNNTCGSASLTLGDVTETMYIGDCNY